jgi:hypothetical protein
VGRLQAARRLDRKGENLARGGGVTGDEGSQRLAFEQLGDDVGGAVVHAHVEDGQDIRVVQGGDGTGLPLEPLQALGAAGHLPGQDLDCDVAAEAWIAGAVDHAHPAFTELFCDLIMAERPADHAKASRARMSAPAIGLSLRLDPILLRSPQS